MNIDIRGQSRKAFMYLFAILAFEMICAAEMFYWPLIQKPGTVLDWWQVEWLATFGNYIYFPVVILSFLGLGKFIYLIFVLWSLFINYFVWIALRRMLNGISFNFPSGS